MKEEISGWVPCNVSNVYVLWPDAAVVSHCMLYADGFQDVCLTCEAPVATATHGSLTSSTRGLDFFAGCEALPWVTAH